ncbi:MAG: caspase family protein, partial [Victivallales bacterium]|nr:caspase family protein [Victivallales bacterium]
MKRKALFIGINNYEDAQIRNLNYAFLDASSLHAVFEDLGYETDILENPTKGEVFRTVRQMTWDLEQGDLFFFYFSGHGFSVSGKELLFCSDDQYEDLRYEYNVGIPFDVLEQRTKGEYNRVFMIDACRSDFLSGSRGTDFATRDLIPIGDMLKGTSGTGSLAIMRSCSKYECSIEIDSRKHGLFTLAMLDILRQFRNTGERIFFDGNLCTNIQTQMRKIAVEACITSPQTPEFTISGNPQILMEGNDIAVDAASAIQGNVGAEQLDTQKNNAIAEEQEPHQDFQGSRQADDITQEDQDNPVENWQNNDSSQKEKSRIAEANRRYEKAILAYDWNEAREAAQQLVLLDVGSMEQWNDKINYCIRQRRFMLEINCKDASDEFDKVFPSDIKAARIALDNMEKNWQLLVAEYNSTPTANSIREGLEKRKSKLATAENNQIVYELRAVEALNAEGSMDGRPMIKLSWSPAEDGVQATKWLILRREKGVSPNVKELATVGTYTFTDDDENLKVGIEYEYGVIPIMEIETAGGKESR